MRDTTFVREAFGSASTAPSSTSTPTVKRVHSSPAQAPIVTGGDHDVGSGSGPYGILCVMGWGRGVLLLVVLAFLIGLPLWLMLTAPRRGLGRDRPRHPFRIPQSIGWFLPTGLPGLGDTDPQETLDIPPVESEPGRSRRNRRRRRRRHT